MKISSKRHWWLAVAVLSLAAVLFFGILPGRIEASRNAVLNPPPYTVSPTAAALHAKLMVVDLHADSLLWDRDLLVKGSRGQVDIPRLAKGNVAIQAFTIVTKSPRGMNIEHNSADAPDNITPLVIAQGWPLKTWDSLAERALFQAAKLVDVERRSQGRFTLLRSAADLDAYLARRAKEPGLVAGFLGVEGAHALDGDLANLDRFHDAGIRMLAPTHFFDNDLAGSAHGLAKVGLTAKGREWVRRMEAKHLLIDLAHASPATFDEVLAMATRPVVVSHGGVKGTCDNTRNLSDAQLQKLASNGGLMAIGYWDTAVCGTDTMAISRAILHVAKVIGVEHVALGSDFDGSVTTPFDTSGVALVTEALLAQGMSEADIAKVMGGNAVALLRQALPPR